MEEAPKDHDFDQRLDGPLQESSGHRPSRVHIAIDTNEQQRPDGLEHTASAHSAQSMPNAPTQTPISPTSPPRRSTQIARQRRTSRDFDVRRDGPYGRPSLTMARRQSSGFSQPHPLPSGQGAEQAVVDEEKAAEGGRAPAPDDAQPPSVETLQSTNDPAFAPEPPPLNYTLRTRKMSIFIFWSLILIDSIAMPIALYFGLWYGTSLSPNAVFSIVTAALGGVSILEYVVRFWRLWKKGSTCRVIGARRSYLDWFHWNFSFAWVVIMIELIV